MRRCVAMFLLIELCGAPMQAAIHAFNPNRPTSTEDAAASHLPLGMTQTSCLYRSRSGHDHVDRAGGRRLHVRKCHHVKRDIAPSPQASFARLACLNLPVRTSPPNARRKALGHTLEDARLRHHDDTHAE